MKLKSSILVTTEPNLTAMKNLTNRKRVSLLLVLSTFFLLSSKAQEITVNAYAFTSEPKIDGYIDKAWDDNEFLTISHVLVGNEPVAKEEFSGEFKISWYDNSLYFLFVVTDDSCIFNEGQPIWLGDNINLYLDLGNEKGEQYDNNDYLCHFKWGNSEYYERYNGDDLIQVNNSKDAVEFAQICDTVKHLFIMEIAIHNLAELNGPSELTESTAIGLDAGIYDCDEEPCFFSYHLSWVDTTGYAWSDPSKLGTAGFGTAMLKAAKLTGTTNISEKANQIKVYPTVVSGNLNIETSIAGSLHIEVFSLLGNRVMSTDTRSKMSTIDVSSLNSGLYFVNISDSHTLISSQKIIVD